MGVFRKVRIVSWMCMCVCVCVREIQNIKKLGLSLRDGITYDFYSFLYTSLYLQIFFLYWVYITFIRKKKKKVYFPKKKANQAPAKCKVSAENSGWTRPGHWPSEAESVFNRVGKETVWFVQILFWVTPKFTLIVTESPTGMFLDSLTDLESSLLDTPPPWTSSFSTALLSRQHVLECPIQDTLTHIPQHAVDWADFLCGSLVHPCTSPYPWY